MFNSSLNKKFTSLVTPFYYYDMGLLEKTLGIIKRESEKYGYMVHYAVKANANGRLMDMISRYGFGADCVSGNEIKHSLERGFPPEKIVFAGVGKTDEEIITGLREKIFCFNVESIPELEVINELATSEGRIAPVAIRINPNVEAFTHKYITTGIEETKFGINLWEIDEVINVLNRSGNIKLAGLHFHIGSQIKRMTAFKALCSRINEVSELMESRNLNYEHINVGGGLGINYENPDELPDFAAYFAIFNELLQTRPGQKVHFELGRSVVGQAGSLVTRVLYVKNGAGTLFVVVDAGMTDLIRPALYNAYHQIDNLSSKGQLKRYNVVGPICESSDTFGKFLELPETKRGDLIAIRSAGAYGEVMVSRYNLKSPPGMVYSDQL